MTRCQTKFIIDYKITIKNSKMLTGFKIQLLVVKTVEKTRRYLLEIQCKAPDKKVEKHETAINYFSVSTLMINIFKQ